MTKQNSKSNLQILERQLHGKSQSDRPKIKLAQSPDNRLNFSAAKVMGTDFHTTVKQDQQYLRQDLIKIGLLAGLVLAIQLISYWFLR